MFNLPDGDLAIIGDVHQKTGWLVSAIRSIVRARPEIQHYIQVGDFGLGVGADGAAFLRKVNRVLKDNGKTLFVLLGNHDDYDKFKKSLPSETYPGTRVFNEAPNIFFFERQAWFNANGKKFLAVSGANSINRADLENIEDTSRGSMKMLKSWWEEEQITDEDVQRAVDGGKIDILLSHDTPTVAFPLTISEAAVGREWYGDDAVLYAEESGVQLQRIMDAVKPETIFHGHYHVRRTLEIYSNGMSTRSESLGKNGDHEGNVVVLRTDGQVEPHNTVTS